MQPPLPAAPQPQGQWQQLKYEKLTSTSDYLDLTWDEFDGQYDEYKVHVRLASVPEYYLRDTYIGVRLRLKNLTSGTNAWHSGSYRYWTQPDNPTATGYGGNSSGGYVLCGRLGQQESTQMVGALAGLASLDVEITGNGQTNPACSFLSTIKNWSATYIPATTRGGFAAYVSQYGTTKYNVTGLRTKMDIYSNLSGTKYHQAGCLSIVYGRRLP